MSSYFDKAARFIIYAVNVHQGGGAALLKPLLCSTNQKKVSCLAFLDKRLKVSEIISSNIQVNAIKPSIGARLFAELKLKNCVKDNDVVLCFGNLPPLFKLNARVMLFVQNRYLIDNIGLHHFNVKTRLRITIERIWLKTFIRNVDTIIVQTPSMQSCVVKHLGCEAVVLPYVDTANVLVSSLTEKKYDFIYVASGEPHKNHKQLVEAWIKLSAEGIYPLLCLTLSQENCRELLTWIYDKVQKYDLKIVNAGFVIQTAVPELYKQSKAMIYPSKLESFGLPLIEAKNANISIIASELDYVRDILDPDETFDPSSPKSIARAVKRFLGLNEKKINVIDPESFVDFCINSNSKRN